MAKETKRSIDDIISEIEQTREREKELLAELSEYRTRINSFFAPEPTPAPRKQTQGTGSKPKAGGLFKYEASRKCPNCNVSGHDLRAHRNHPEKFTKEELETAKKASESFNLSRDTQKLLDTMQSEELS